MTYLYQLYPFYRCSLYVYGCNSLKCIWISHMNETLWSPLPSVGGGYIVVFFIGSSNAARFWTHSLVAKPCIFIGTKPEDVFSFHIWEIKGLSLLVTFVRFVAKVAFRSKPSPVLVQCTNWHQLFLPTVLCFPVAQLQKEKVITGHQWTSTTVILQTQNRFDNPLRCFFYYYWNY